MPMPDEIAAWADPTNSGAEYFDDPTMRAAVSSGNKTAIAGALSPILAKQAEDKARAAKIDEFYRESNKYCAELVQKYLTWDYSRICDDLPARGFESQGVDYNVGKFNPENQMWLIEPGEPFNYFKHKKFAAISFRVFSSGKTAYFVDRPDELFDTFFEMTSLSYSVYFASVMGPAASAAGGAAPYALAAYNAAKSAQDSNDFLDSFGIAALKTWANTPEVQTVNPVNDTQNFDLTPVDYGEIFNPVDYSSGEAFPVFSDNQTVDYGFGVNTDMGAPTDWGASALTDPLAPPPTISFNGTPENLTSDFGTVAYQLNGPSSDLWSVANIKSAIQIGQGAVGLIAQTKAVTSGGGAKYSVTGPVMSPPINGAGVRFQNEAAQRTVQRGQLSPDRPVEGFGSGGSMLAIAALVVGGYFIMRRGGK
jgi:hypothetical protein